MLVMVVFFIAFRWIHLSTPLIRLFLLVLILLLMPTLNFLPVWFALSLLRFRLPSRLPMMSILWMIAMMVWFMLRGKVLPIGCVKEKLLAAHRAGIRTVILPQDNQKDLADIPANIKAELTIHFVESMDEVLKIALTSAPTPILDDAADDVAFRPPVGGGGDLQESIMH